MTELLNIMGLPLLTCLALTIILGYPGLHVIRREVIFIDIAVAQIAALGAISSHIFLHLPADSPAATFCAFGATLLAAFFFATVRHKITTLPIEAAIGITYAVAAAATLFIIGKHSGHSHIQQMLTGNLLWVKSRDVARAFAIFAFTAVCFAFFHRRFRLISDNYEQAGADGVNVIAWDFLFYALCGIIITVAVRLAGVVVVFSFLIIPAVTSALFSDKWRSQILITWAAGFAGSVMGLIFCQVFDFSAGVSVSLFLGMSLTIIGVVKTRT
jgi:zinc/manganese transport system permease protein